VLFLGGKISHCFVANKKNPLKSVEIIFLEGKNAQKLPYFEEKSQKLLYFQIEFPKVAKQSTILKKNITFFGG
jgi:hypothetical protein